MKTYAAKTFESLEQNKNSGRLILLMTFKTHVYIAISKCYINEYVAICKFYAHVYVAISKCYTHVYIAISKCYTHVYVAISKY